MTVTVEEVTVGPLAAAGSPTVTLTTTPQPGDVLVLLVGQRRSTCSAPSRSRAGCHLGGRCQLRRPPQRRRRRHRRDRGRHVTAPAAAPPTSSDPDAGARADPRTGQRSGRGDGYGGASSVLTGNCSLGQIRIGHEVGFDAAMATPSTSPPRRPRTGCRAHRQHRWQRVRLMYRIGTAIGLQAQPINLDGAPRFRP